MRATVPKTEPMTADAFIEWAAAHPEAGRFELIGGEVVAMAPERSRHALAKAEAWLELRRAVEAAKLPCTVYPDGMTVKIDDVTAYEPDALVRCGEALPGDAVAVPDPVIVVEVLSPSTGRADTATKLAGYLSLPTLRHYLIIDPERRVVVHHRRDETGAIATAVVQDGTLALDPPGLTLRVAGLA